MLCFCSSCCLRACSSAWRFALLVVYKLVHQPGVFALLVVYELVHQPGVLFFLLFTSLFISLAFLFFLLFTSLFISLAFCSSCCLRVCSSARRFVLLVVYELVHQPGVFHPLAYELVPRLDASHLLAFELLRLLPFSSSFCRYLLFCSVRSNFLLVAVVFQK